MTDREVDAQGDQGAHAMDSTLDYQLRQLPRHGIYVHQWESVFYPPIKLPPPAFERSQSTGSDGLTEVLIWKLDPAAIQNGASVVYKEFGYDENGFVGAVNLGDSADDTSITERIRVTNPAAVRRYGREWIFSMSGILDDSLCSIAALQLCREMDLAHSRSEELASSRTRLARAFLLQFKSSWDLTSSRRWWGSSDHESMRSGRFAGWEDLVFQYHMRVCTADVDVSSGLTLWQAGLVRSSGKLHNGKQLPLAHVVELRYAVGLKTTWKFEQAVFTLFTMADSGRVRLRSLDELSNEWQWRMAGIVPLQRATGVAAFAFRIHSLLPEWERQWSSLIDTLGKALNSNANLDAILSPAGRRSIMIDRSGLQLSEFYFTMMQTLRIASEWIQESMDDLRHMVNDMERLYLSPQTPEGFPTFLPLDATKRDEFIRVYRSNWNSVLLHQQNIGSELLSRIAKKQEELKSLRDGLFNATSINEAAKSTQLNHYILAFTVVTIFYLPLSFIATLFALDFFDLKEDPRQTKWFIATTVSVAIGTYVACWLLVWIVQEPNRRELGWALAEVMDSFAWAMGRGPGLRGKRPKLK
ncbi:hypothetical protein V8F06_011917 [Rhypophila decipiens]